MRDLPSPADRPPLPPDALPVAVDSPLPQLLSYASEQALPSGTLVRVPLGSRRVTGMVAAPGAAGDVAPAALKPVAAVFESIPPLSAGWQRLAQFAADYYQRPLGEIVAASLPPPLLDNEPAYLERVLDKLIEPTYAVTAAGAQAIRRSVPDRFEALALLARRACEGPLAPSEGRALHRDAARHLSAWYEAGWLRIVPREAPPPRLRDGPPLTAQQQQALAHLAAPAGGGFRPSLLWGATGSGKTEVYMQLCGKLLAADPQIQVLVLVPEINLTPQLEAAFRERFDGGEVVTLHSGLADGERLRNWLKAHLGVAQIVLGTRMAVLASLPRLRLIVVDEEHDASYKQQEGARYSARDLAVARAQIEGIPVVLGSATPSLESWHAARQGRYARVDMPQRIGEAAWPQVRIADMRRVPRDQWLAPAVCAAIEARIARGEQSLVFLNRRGYAPVITCAQCGWLSACPHCSAYQVFHKSDRSLRCHHCSTTRRVPVACPDCGSLDLRPVGHGTQRLEEWLAERFPQARIARIDADTTRRKGSAAAAFADVHAGEVDILVGTQMVTKGHDFRRVSLVAAVGVDSALYSANFRASEALFAHLMQAAGRAGRAGLQSEMWVQTAFAAHALFTALKAHDYAAFARHLLAEREQAGMPPYSFLALARAEARTQDEARGFLQQARDAGQALAAECGVTLYAPVPMALQRVADTERAQMLIECARRKALQRFLRAWLATLRAIKTRVRWAVDVDPLEI